jgi:hypothetical protein
MILILRRNLRENRLKGKEDYFELIFSFPARPPGGGPMPAAASPFFSATMARQKYAVHRITIIVNELPTCNKT